MKIKPDLGTNSEDTFRLLRHSVPVASVMDGAEVGKKVRCISPDHDDRDPSMHVYEDHVYCFSCKLNADVVKAWGILKGIDKQIDAARDLAAAFDVDLSGPDDPANGSGAKGKAKTKGKAKEKPTATWEIRDRSGKHWADHVRFDNPDDPDGKECLWRLPSGKWGLHGIKLQDMPLYGSELVDSWPREQAVILVEGEPAKDAAHKAGLNALGTVTGAGGTPGPEALEVARDRTVVLWPDNDPEGREHMHRIGAALQGVAAEVLWFEWAGAPPKGDAADHPAVVGDDPEALADLKRQLFEAAPWTPPPSREEEAWAACGELARQENLTAAFADALKQSGVAGESRLLRILYLVLTSRRLDKPVSVAIKGASSGGKSYTVEKVLDTFPDSAYYALTSMSEKALIYLDEDMRHRFLVVYEASGMAGDMQTYLMRTLLSENRIRYQTAEATSQGVKPRLLELEGPTGLIVTTTQTRMHPENETRMIS